MIKRLVIAAVIVGASACTTARGEKIGTITKLSEEGYWCPTWEGQIIRGGMSGGSGAFGAPFDFTVERGQVEQVRLLMESGQEIRLHYITKPLTFCSTNSGHFVMSIEAMKR